MTPPPEETGLNSALERNIGALRAHRRREDATARFDDRVSDAITGFAGSLAFVYVHVALVSVWTAVNLGLVPGVVRFDPTFVILATVASVEAIFLSTFVLISQNRAAERANRRDELDLHINLLTEHEVTDRPSPRRAARGGGRAGRTGARRGPGTHIGHARRA